MRGTVAKRLRKRAIEVAKEVYNKTSSIIVPFPFRHWQKGSVVWCYKQLKIAWKKLNWKEKYASNNR